MNERIMFKNMDHSDVLEAYAQEQLKKIEHSLVSERTPIDINLVLEGHPTHAHNKVELIVSASDFKLVAHHEGPDFHDEIKRVIDTMLQEIRKEQEKQADFRTKKDDYKSA